MAAGQGRPPRLHHGLHARTHPRPPELTSTPVTPEALDLAIPRPRLPSPLRDVVDERFARHGVRLLLKRDDLIHPDLVGNKWRELAERPLNPSLTRCAADGMRLHFVDRPTYRHKTEPETLVAILREAGAEDA